MATVAELGDPLGRDEIDAVFVATAGESLAIVEQFVRAAHVRDCCRECVSGVVRSGPRREVVVRGGSVQ